AERHTRAGELAQAMWTYLQVLEVDPDNAVARRQVGMVATAVRQFDRVAPGRRWLRKVRDEAGWPVEEDGDRSWLQITARVGVAAAVAFMLGCLLGLHLAAEETSTDAPRQEQQPKTLGR